MSDPRDVDRRIDEQERELARLQTDSTYTQIESNLARDALKAAIAVAAVFASVVHGAMTALADGFDDSVETMADDLNGRDDGK